MRAQDMGLCWLQSNKVWIRHLSWSQGQTLPLYVAFFWDLAFHDKLWKHQLSFYSSVIRYLSHSKCPDRDNFYPKSVKIHCKIFCFLAQTFRSPLLFSELHRLLNEQAYLKGYEWNILGRKFLSSLHRRYKLWYCHSERSLKRKF